VHGRRWNGNDGRVGSKGRTLAEFDATFPFLVFAADFGVGRFFRYDASLIEDAVAETVARTYEHWERVRRDKNPIAWVAGCSMEVCLERLRADETTTSETIVRALDRLPKRQREVAVLRCLMDCDEPTTAAAMGVTVLEVRSTALDAWRQLGAPLSGVYREAPGLSI
jgi:DNA-directed RNA polymerase specialized sigma24 family protein